MRSGGRQRYPPFVALRHNREAWISLAAVGALTMLMYVHASGRVSTSQAAAIVLFPGLAAAAIFRPAWILLGLVGIPPGLLLWTPALTTPLLTAVLGGALCLLLAVRGRLHMGIRSGVGPIALLIVMAYSFRADVGGAAADRADEVVQSLLFYAVILLLSYNLTRMGQLSFKQLRLALAFGLLLTAMVFLVEVSGNPLQVPPEPGLLSHRTHLGYLMAMGFALAFARPLTRDADGDEVGQVSSKPRSATPYRLREGAGLVVFGTATLLSQTRGAWLAALVTILLVSWMVKKRSYWLLVPALMVVVTTIPVMNERLFSDVSEGFRHSIETGRIGTGRWSLWNRLWDVAEPALPLGKGFGYTWSLTSLTLFGVPGQFRTPTSAFIYPHNDFLFWLLELGIVGVGAVVAFWAHLAVVVRRSLAARDVLHRYATVGLVGLFIAGFVASIVDNAIFIRPIAERLFVVAGFAFALAAQREHVPEDLGATAEGRIGGRGSDPSLRGRSR